MRYTLDLNRIPLADYQTLLANQNLLPGRRLLHDGHMRLIVPDLVLYEVLRGFREERALRQARLLLQTLRIEPCGGEEVALAAAEHYRHLRARGVTVRSGIDVMIAAFCIDRDYLLLHSDRDYDAMAAHRGLRVWGQ